MRDFAEVIMSIAAATILCGSLWIVFTAGRAGGVL